MRIIIILIGFFITSVNAQIQDSVFFELNDFKIHIPKDYKLIKTKKSEITLINEKSEEILVGISKKTNFRVLDSSLKKIVTGGNQYLSWKLLDPLEKDVFLATIMKGPKGVMGYRAAFYFKNRIIFITTFSRTFKEAFSKLIEMVIDIKAQ
jgi:hypothetical protein